MIIANVESVVFISTVLIVLGVLTLDPLYAHPMDLYDDVSDFFEAVSLDDVLASRNAEPETFCRMAARKGVCRALIPRWSYNAKKKDCFEFKFGGCDGNENNFSSYKQCMETCEGM